MGLGGEKGTGPEVTCGPWGGERDWTLGDMWALRGERDWTLGDMWALGGERDWTRGDVGLGGRKGLDPR